MDYLLNDTVIELHTHPQESSIATRRKLLGYSQALLAQKAGISLRTLQQYESHARDINKASVQTLWLLSRALQCPMEDLVDLYIDDVTDCIKHRETGQDYVTRYEIVSRKISSSEVKADKKLGWKFDWAKIQANGYKILELFTQHDNHIQGRISYKEMDGYFFVDHVENSPSNIGHDGLYDGVGANLFAIICLLSKQAGFEGVISFYSKSDSKLIANYIDKLHAHQIGSSQLMIIDEAAASYLISKYQLED